MEKRRLATQGRKKRPRPHRGRPAPLEENDRRRFDEEVDRRLADAGLPVQQCWFALAPAQTMASFLPCDLWFDSVELKDALLEALQDLETTANFYTSLFNRSALFHLVLFCDAFHVRSVVPA